MRLALALLSLGFLVGFFTCVMFTSPRRPSRAARARMREERRILREIAELERMVPR
jgi:type II secretory pathway component PulJ